MLILWLERQLRRHSKYPKPGTRNPTITLRVADLADPKSIRTRELTPPPILLNQ
ncbi:dipeptidyl-peptidase [Culex quinquefasciatus]|uniref:Dipeptidyl-peptidase n=1 Tax=Culex quinquefasciatus TaxID=7176 RepID=B0XGA6_CULQU|nr:dipeptidyl-peptidase [Culex quinquefasciatus]|eukprot:XP_001868678.1 dipeptidyl-peptidase [Culex quinquefasciatus]